MPQAAQEARWLAEAAWDRPSGSALLDLPDAGLARFEALLARRTAGEPLAHVLGHADFRRLRLRSDRRALIPRPETEVLVELVLARQRTGRVADIGTGTGCIALALADEGAYDEVVAVEADPAALALAAENVAATGLAVTLHHGDLLAPLAGDRLDAIVSNPPYLSAAEHAALDPSVGAWEPRRALVAGPDGLLHARRLLREGAAHLVPGGLLALELDAARIRGLAADAARLGWRDPAVHLDPFGRARYLIAHRE